SSPPARTGSLFGSAAGAGQDGRGGRSRATTRRSTSGHREGPDVHGRPGCTAADTRGTDRREAGRGTPSDAIRSGNGRVGTERVSGAGRRWGAGAYLARACS